MAEEQDLDFLIQEFQKVNPKLHEVLSRLINDVTSMKRDLTPLVQRSKVTDFGVADIPIPGDLSVGFTRTTINLKWTSPDPSIRLYEVRQGTDWDTADFITITPTADIHIVPSPGSPLVFLIKSINVNNERSVNTATLIASPELPGTTPLQIEVIDNFVLLRWVPPSSTFEIKEYEIYKGSEFLGKREGTFTQFFEQVEGDYTYSIYAVDVAGNKGSSSSVTVHVNQPPDYILTAKKTSTFGGTKFRVKVYFDPSISEAA